MYPLLFILLTGFSSFTSAKECTDITVSVSLSARQGVFDIAIPQTNHQVVGFSLNVTQQGRNFTDVALTGYQTISNTYSISTCYCKPTNDTSKDPSIQVLTHGIGFDKTYWDLPYYPNGSTYIDLATDTYNQHTLSYDRLGLGASSRGDPLNEIQLPLEVSLLQALTTLLRSGTFPNIPTTFSKTSHIGHSFGSFISYSFADAYPSLSNALVLTGFTLDAAYVGLYLAGNHFTLANRDNNVKGRAGEGYADGYLVSSDSRAIEYLHLKPGFFDPAVLDEVTKGKQPVALGELLTILSVPVQNHFVGPVLVIAGDSDLVFCGSDCLDTVGYDPEYKSIPEKVKDAFPHVDSSNFTAYIQPNTGHAINLHYNSTGANKVINEFLIANGCS